MKQLSLLLIGIFCGCISYAQTTSGNMMLGGTFSLNSVNYENNNNKYSSFTVAPSFGYFVADNLAVGAGISYTNTTSGTGNAKTTGTDFGIGPFARYYKFTSSENFAFFAQAGLNLGFGKNDPAVGNTTKDKSTSFYISPGFSYFFNKHWGLDLALTGLVINSVDPNTSTTNDKYTTIVFDIRSLSPSFGLRYYFGQ